MTDPIYQSTQPATLPAGFEVSVSLDSQGRAVQNVATGNGDPLLTVPYIGFNVDAFQRQRVSNTDTRLDVEFIYGKQPLIMDDISAGGGSTSHNANTRDVTLTLGASVGSAAAGLRQHWYNVYTPGNSQLIAITGTLNGASLGGSASYFLRSSISGSAVTTTYPQTGWDAASAGVNWSNSQIFLIDFQSLKVGRLRFALDRDGEAVQVGVIHNDNDRPGGYWQSANLPVYWRVFNSGSLSVTEIGYGDELNAAGFRFETPISASHTARAICATVKSEGGGALRDVAGLQFAAGNGATTATVGATMIPLMSIQVAASISGYLNRSIAIPEIVNFVTDQTIFWRLVRNSTLSGASWAAVDANSGVNFDITASAASGGIVIASGYAGAGGTRSAGQTIGLTGRVPLSLNAAGTTGDTLTVMAARVGTVNATVGAEIGWKELR